MGELLLGCSGWNYPDTAEKGGWTEVFYPDKDTKRLRYYSQFFNTAEMDSTFYEKFYSNMTRVCESNLIGPSLDKGSKRDNKHESNFSDRRSICCGNIPNRIHTKHDNGATKVLKCLFRYV